MAGKFVLGNHNSHSANILNLSLAPQSIFEDIKYHFGDILNEKLRNRIKILNAEEYYADTVNWLPQKEKVLNSLIERFKDSIQFIVGFHGCRPVSVDSYYNNGLLSHNIDLLLNSFRSIFSDIDDIQLNEAIEKDSNSINEHRKLFFFSKPEDFDTTTNHYILYGSERILGLARKLEKQFGYSDQFASRLRANGIPTIFKVHIPTKQITEHEIKSIVKELATFWAKNTIDPTKQHSIDYCYLAYGDINKKHILEHIHPKSIQCPYSHRKFATKNIDCCDAKSKCVSLSI